MGPVWRRAMLLATVTLIMGATVVPVVVRAAAFNVSSGYFHVTKLGPDNTACDIAYDLYVPNGADAQHQVPAILTTNGFGGSKSDQASEAKLWASNGFEALSYSGLGFGGSSCPVELDAPDWDGRAASQLVSWLGDNSAHPEVIKDGPGDPRVGTFGGSYGGGFQFALAAVDTRIDAMIPVITWNDLSYSLTPNNNARNFIYNYGATAPGVPKLEWTSLFYALGNAEPGLNPGRSGWTNSTGAANTGTPPNPACPGFNPAVCPAYNQGVADGYPNKATIDLVRHASAQYELFDAYPPGKHFPPTMLIQGETDTLFDMAEAVANYRGFKSKHAPVKLVMEFGGHSGSGAPGEVNNTDQSKGYLTQLEVTWWNRYLKHQNVLTGPAVEYFRDWVRYDPSGSAQAAYGSAPAWPVGTTTRLYMSGSGDLVPTKGQIKPGTVSFVGDPSAPASFSEVSAVPQGSQPAPSDTAGTFAAFATKQLKADVDLVGVPTLDFSITDAVPNPGHLPALDLVLFGKIYDVDASGNKSLVHRLIAPVRVADTTKPIHINLPGLVHRYPAGHTIQLVLATSDAAFSNSRGAHALTISPDPAHPFVLSLPVLQNNGAF